MSNRTVNASKPVLPFPDDMNPEDPDITVIVPVKDPGEDRIRKCLDSLLSQVHPRIEFIFIDNCGNDGSMDIVGEAASYDPRIRIIRNTEDLGPGEGRNKGIEAARGKYLSFIDSDDYISDEFFFTLYKKACERDMDVVKPVKATVKESPDGSLQLLDTDEIMCRYAEEKQYEGIHRFMFYFRNFHGAIFRRELFEDKDIRFGATISSEDITFLLRVCTVVRSFSYTGDAIYYRRLWSGSLIRQIDSKRISDHIISLQEQLACIDSQVDRSEAYYRLVYTRINRCLGFANIIALTPLKDDAEEFLSGIRDIVIKRADCKELSSRYFEIDILCRYGNNLSRYVEESDSDVQKAMHLTQIISQWVRFAKLQPTEKARLRSEYSNVLRTAIDFLSGSKGRWVDDSSRHDLLKMITENSNAFDED